MGKTDSNTIAQVIKAHNDNMHNVPELVWDENTQTFITVPAGKAKETGMPEATEMGTDVFHSVH